MSGPVYVHNGPTNLAALENVNLDGAQLVFNGAFNMRDLRRVNFDGAIVFINGQLEDESQLLKPGDRPLLSSSRANSHAPESDNRAEDHSELPSRSSENYYSLNSNRIDRYRPSRSSDYYRPGQGDSNAPLRSIDPMGSPRNTGLEMLNKSDWPKSETLKLKSGDRMSDAYVDDPNRLSPQLFAENPESGEIEETDLVMIDSNSRPENPEPRETRELVPKLNSGPENPGAGKLRQSIQQSSQWFHPERLESLKRQRSSSPEPPPQKYVPTGANAVATGLRPILGPVQMDHLRAAIHGHMAGNRSKKRGVCVGNSARAEEAKGALNAIPLQSSPTHSQRHQSHAYSRNAHIVSQVNNLVSNRVPNVPSQVGGVTAKIDHSLLDAKELYAQAEQDLRLERQRHGRANDATVQRLKDRGRELAILYGIQTPKDTMAGGQKARPEKPESVAYIQKEDEKGALGSDIMMTIRTNNAVVESAVEHHVDVAASSSRAPTLRVERVEERILSQGS